LVGNYDLTTKNHLQRCSFNNNDSNNHNHNNNNKKKKKKKKNNSREVEKKLGSFLLVTPKKISRKSGMSPKKIIYKDEGLGNYNLMVGIPWNSFWGKVMIVMSMS